MFIMSEIRELQHEICQWADQVFPDRTIQAAALKLYEEIGEMLRDPSDAAEHADIFIMLLDISAMYDIDVAQAIRDKMEINRARTWRKTQTGTLQHTER
jgi:NTP pyrophosphatase (non-canonical NTP hydrolase)